MKKTCFMFISLSLIAGLWVACSSDGEKAGKGYDDHNVRSSGCLDTRGDEEVCAPFIVLKKEGDIISGEFHNFQSDCITPNFIIESDLKNSASGMDTLEIFCKRGESDVFSDCRCHFNIYFVVRDVKADSLWLKCWLPNSGYDNSFEGEVRLNADSSVVLRPQKHLFDDWCLEGYGSDGKFQEIPKDSCYYYIICLSSDHAMSGTNLCNTIYGTFELDGQSFTFTSYGGSEVLCVGETAQFFDENMQKVYRYLIDENARLRLYYSESEYLRFRSCH